MIKAIRLKAPLEFVEWIDKRRQGMIKLVNNNPKKVLKRLTKMDTMRIISQTDGVDIPEELIRKIKKKVGIKRC